MKKRCLCVATVITEECIHRNIILIVLVYLLSQQKCYCFKICLWSKG